MSPYRTNAAPPPEPDPPRWRPPRGPSWADGILWAVLLNAATLAALQARAWIVWAPVIALWTIAATLYRPVGK